VLTDEEIHNVLFDYQELYEKLSNNISCENRLEDFRWNKYSSTSAQRYDIDGKIGKIILRGDLKPFLLMLKLAECFHVGKHTGCGMGKYVLEIKE
jgi:CRISPR/Cas system endoribonuclease Cas6 (RAMP superfamily)